MLPVWQCRTHAVFRLQGCLLLQRQMSGPCVNTFCRSFFHIIFYFQQYLEVYLGLGSGLGCGLMFCSNLI
jgi:hypothetical protein